MGNRGNQGVSKVMAGEFKVKTSPTHCFSNTELVNVYPLIKRDIERFKRW